MPDVMSDDSIELRWRRQRYTVDERVVRWRWRTDKKTALSGDAATPKKKRAKTTGVSRPKLSPAPRGGEGGAPTKRIGSIDATQKKAPAKRVELPTSPNAGRPVEQKTFEVAKRSASRPNQQVATVGVGDMRLADRRQRCIVKVNYVRHGQGGGAAPLQTHLRYLERESAGASDPFGQSYLGRHGQSMFGPGGSELELWQLDRHHFRFVLAPEHGGRLDVQSFATRFMQALEQKLSKTKSIRSPLEWGAVTHHNTDHPHAHVVLRGKTQDGRDLVIPKTMIRHGMRELARDLVTAELGYRLAPEIEADLHRQVTQPRLTEIDRVIAHHVKGQSIDAASLGALERNRLEWLVRHELAQRKDNADRSFELAPDWQAQLRQKGEDADIVRQLQREWPGHSEIKTYRKNLGQPDIVGEVEQLTTIDDNTDRVAAIVRDSDDQAWLVEISHGQAERMEIGDRIRISTTRQLPSGRTTRSPFIRIETLTPAIERVQALALAVTQAVSQEQSPEIEMDLD